jgi:long-chain acyl-CoA synthetase
VHFSQKDFVEVWDKVFDTLGPYPSVVYAYDSGKELNLTYNDIRELEMDVIRDFTARGFVPGDRVAITGPPSPHYLFFSHAMSYMGITCALIDNTLPTEEIEKLITTADPCAVISTPKILGSFSEEFKAGKMLFELDKDDRLAAHVDGTPETVVTHTVDPDTDVMLILFSSGTTGKMKGAKLSYHSIIRGLEVDCKICDLADRPIGTTSFFYVLPINHIAGFMSVTGAFFCGTELKFLEEITPLRYLEGLKKYQPTHFLTVPAVYDVMEQKAFETIRQKGRIVNWAIRSLFNFSGFMREKTGRTVGKRIFKKIYSQFLGNNIECVVTGASPCKDSTARFFVNMGLQWANYYASTETCIPVCAIWASDKDKYGYSGYTNAIDFVEIRIGDIDSEGIGEIQVKTDIVMNGYFRDPEATAAAFDGEWFRTGDRGYIDNENKLHIVGRIKESIVLRTGKKVASHDVDD